MALKKTYQRDGVTITDAYIKVGNINGTKNWFSFTVEIKANQDAHPVMEETHSIAPSMEGGNFVKQAYEHLKTLPEFAGAEDC